MISVGDFTPPPLSDVEYRRRFYAHAAQQDHHWLSSLPKSRQPWETPQQHQWRIAVVSDVLDMLHDDGIYQYPNLADIPEGQRIGNDPDAPDPGVSPEEFKDIMHAEPEPQPEPEPQEEEEVPEWTTW